MIELITFQFTLAKIGKKRPDVKGCLRSLSNLVRNVPFLPIPLPQPLRRNTSTECAPWYVVPADHKWFTRLVVAEGLIHSLEELDLSFPKMDSEKRRDMKKAQAALKREK